MCVMLAIEVFTNINECSSMSKIPSGKFSHLEISSFPIPDGFRDGLKHHLIPLEKTLLSVL